MKTIIIIVFICSFSLSGAQPLQDSTRYLKVRDSLLMEGQHLSFSGGIHLNDDEREVQGLLSALKKEAAASLYPSQNFYDVKEKIEQTRLFAFLHNAPKGGVLHLHTKATTSVEWMVDTLITLKDAYVNWSPDKKKKGEILFTRVKLPDYKSASEFADKKLRNELIALLTLGPEDKANLWEEFINCFARTKGFVTYEPLFKPYYKQGMKELIRDHIQYVELRAGISSKFYSLENNGKPYFDPAKNVKYLLEVRNELQRSYPFFDMKLIYAAQRSDPRDTVLKELERAYRFNSNPQYKDFVIGFDLIGEEDAGHTTLYYLPVWLQQVALAKKYTGTILPLYLHDGESNRIENHNLYDATILKSRRVGHGFNLHYFPALQAQMKKEGRTVEVCPVSNQVLGYVHDLRNHPGADFLKAGLNIVLSNDDPGVFHYQGLSYDFWEAVMAWDLNLADVKQLCINSLEKSAMTAGEREKALAAWQGKWKDFIKSQISTL